MDDTDTFSTVPGFCPDCGAVLPLLRDKGNVMCFSCRREFGPEIFENLEVKYTLYFNSVDVCTKNSQDKKKRSKRNENEGPVVERKCPKCGNERMSYATLQLRSADEGQTVFYTCTKCKFKETENS